jgi:tryptophan synthase alpha chain
MSAIDELFQRTRAEGRKAFIPFVTAGDPDMDFTIDVLATLVERGADLCEVGIPYSDPIADGPVIQASYSRALDKKIKVEQIIAAIGKNRARLTAPMVTMVSYAIVHRHGIEKYVLNAKAAGISGAIIPDLLIEEAAGMAEVCKKHDFSLIQLITPTTPRDRALRIASTSTGFVYYVSVTGITGERTQLPPELLDSVGWLREQTKLPICIGFGINQPEHIKLLSPVVDGLIVGSGIVRRIAEASQRPRADVLKEIGEYAATLVKACRPV